MADPAQQLCAIYAAGFDVRTYDRFPNALGLSKGNCVALVQPAPDGLKLLGLPGWRMGEVIGVLVERRGAKYFQAKDELVEATQERLAELETFRYELELLMTPQA